MLSPRSNPLAKCDRILFVFVEQRGDDFFVAGHHAHEFYVRRRGRSMWRDGWIVETAAGSPERPARGLYLVPTLVSRAGHLAAALIVCYLARVRGAAMNFSFVHEFDIDPAGYWKIFLSPDFNKDMFGELKMKKYEVLEQNDDGKQFHREQVCEPSTPIPGFLQSVVKSTGYTEIDDLDWAHQHHAHQDRDRDVQRSLQHARRLHRHAARRRQALAPRVQGRGQGVGAAHRRQASRSS